MTGKSGRAELCLAGVTVIWGTTFVLVKSALADVSTVLFLAMRFTLAAIVLVSIYRKALRGNGILPGLLAGCLLFTAFVFQTKGLELTSASKSAFLTGLSIPMVPLASSLVYRIRPRMTELAGVLIASVGMALMTLPAGRFEMSRGDFLSFLCAVVFALHIVVVSHYSPIVGFQTLAVAQVATAALLATVSFSFIEPARFRLSGGVAAAVLVTGVLATALAFTAMAWAQQYTSATRAALIFALEPVFACCTSYVLLGEKLPGRGKIGAVVILAGILTVELKRGGIAPDVELKRT
ncbi:MAG TPA: DMT family transporter [Bryobacteraceae bacterium]|nr:DMT family transporter [Bryobacteraceae bacterium]